MRATISLLLSLVFCAPCLALEPSPALSPKQVVRHQLDSLQSNNETDDGIASTFDFASPANKRMTGPLSRFSGLFDIPQYAPMLNHQSAEIEEVSNDGQLARFKVELIDSNGSIHHYRFDLSRQSGGSCTDCWMTDSVMWDPQPGRSA